MGRPHTLIGVLLRLSRDMTGRTAGPYPAGHTPIPPVHLQEHSPNEYNARNE